MKYLSAVVQCLALILAINISSNSEGVPRVTINKPAKAGQRKINPKLRVKRTNNCQRNVNCKIGTTCINSKCVGANACKRSSDCQLGTICINDKYTAGCNSRRDCPSNLDCINKRCR